MRAHTRKHHTEKNVTAGAEHKGSVEWRSAFGDLIDKFTESGAALRGFRLREGMTQIELAEQTGVNQANISKMEHGKRSIGKSMAKKFAVLFKTDYKIFL